MHALKLSVSAECGMCRKEIYLYCQNVPGFSSFGVIQLVSKSDIWDNVNLGMHLYRTQHVRDSVGSCELLTAKWLMFSKWK